jgi:glycine cleavage system H protein
LTPQPCDPVSYRRGRFSGRFPADRLYTPNHHWLQEVGPQTWRVGLTSFALRTLGEIVECDFEVEPGLPVQADRIVGWIEGLKALNDLYSAVSGTFLGGNPQLRRQVVLVEQDPFGAGWLYEASGLPHPAAFDARRYTCVLDAEITRLRGETSR